MNEVLESTKFVVDWARFVRIDEDAASSFAGQVVAHDLEGSEFDDSLLVGASEEERTAFVFIYDAVNFCYWGEPKWTIAVDGQFYDGGTGMLTALKRAVADGFPLLQADYLAEMTEADLSRILAGNVVIPLFEERLRLLRQLGQSVMDKYGGSFVSVVQAADFQADTLVRLLARDFAPIFNDEAEYHGHAVMFYKRAQLIPAHLSDLGRFNLVSWRIEGYKNLTAFADYKVPQLLRKFGILVYKPELAGRIDRLEELPPGSDEEIEIRAATIWAVELVTRELKKRFPEVAAAQVDGIFWFKGQTKHPDDKPYHRTRTIWY